MSSHLATDVMLVPPTQANPRGMLAYGWIKIQSLTKEQSVTNADNFMFTGVLAKLLDMQYRLSNVASLKNAGALLREPGVAAIPPGGATKRHECDTRITKHAGNMCCVEFVA